MDAVEGAARDGGWGGHGWRGRPGAWRRAWEVVLVGRDGGTCRAAHTAGLAGLGLPELFLTALPTHGDDRGVGWRLSRGDMASLLDDFAVLALSGELRSGRSVVEPMDGGLSSVTFTPAAARPAASVCAALPPDRAVVPLHWRLRRPPARRSVGLPDRGVPLPAESRARVVQLDRAGPGPVGGFLHCLDLARTAGQGPAGLRPVLAALARATGREGVLAATDREAWRLAAVLRGRVHDPGTAPAGAHPRALLLDGVRALLGAEALADHLPADLLARARGPWEWALHGGRLPGPDWRAPGWALRAVADLLSACPPGGLVEAGRSLGRAAHDPGWSAAHDRLMGLVATGAAAADDAVPVLQGDRLAGLSAPEVALATGVEVLLVPATARGDALGLDAWRALTAPLRPALGPLPDRPPGLPPR